MKGQRKHTPEQVVRKLREADKLLAEGKTVLTATLFAHRSAGLGEDGTASSMRTA